LRIGYVSPDFWRHSCAHYVLPLFAGHDHNRYQIICYSDVRQPDSFTRRLQACADLWHDTYGLKDEALVELIRRDEVDILVDLNGHFAGTRLLAFARKPAPVQVTWLGYPNTTGLTTIDYRLVDPVTDPPGEADAYHSEALVRLSTGFLCYTPVPEAPEPAPAPCLEKGYVTFGSFNNMAKVTPEVIALWAAILQRVPTARLVLKSRQLDDAGTRRRFAALLHAHGIAEERFDLLPWSLRPDDHMGAYHGLDIALDPFPYNGTTTTCEALWMGVPVLSLMGDRHAGRVGASLLTTLGLSDWIATDPADYVDRAARLAADPAGLAELHRTLRARLVDSPLFNAAAFARMVEAAYRAMWQRWCAGQAPAPFILTPGP
jgi:predicted O-linked N-acetylglucosamine transferase (SPINDLY family)